MNSYLSGERPAIGGHVLSVDSGLRVLVDGRPVAAGTGIARDLARLVVPDLPADAAERAIAVDQTNTSVIVDDRLVVKVVGSWAAADRAGDLLERLAAAAYPDIAPLRGRVEWRHPLHGTATLAIVTGYLPGADDGWTWAVDDVVAHLGGAAEPDWPGPLGRRVARMHDVLGADATPAGAEAPAARLARAEDALQRALAAAEGPAGDRLRNRRAPLEHDVRTLGRTAPGLVFPIHGDLHVGQVLASPIAAAGSGPGDGSGDGPGDGPGDGSAERRYTIIDFDGDPQLAAAERERPDAAARDVAHLLVSLDLVAAVAQKRRRAADPAAFAWADRARRAFLEAYLAELVRPELFDAALLPGFEAEQLAAELHYADRYLPAWRYAPDAAITHRHPSTHDHPEEPWTPPPSAPTST